jgi:zinc protease
MEQKATIGVNLQPDRTMAPAFGTLDKVEIAEAGKSLLPGGIPVFKIDAGIQELVKIEIIFPGAGATSQPTPLVSVGTNDMLDEGTVNYSASALAEQVDFYGAFLQTEATLDFASVCLFSLNKHLTNTIPLLKEMIKNANFPEHEFDTYIQNKKQKFRVDEAKVSTVARKKFTQILFGDKHPYGNYIIEDNFKSVNRNLLSEFHTSAYSLKDSYIVVSGKMDPRMDDLLARSFQISETLKKDNIAIKEQVPNPDRSSQKHFVEKKEAVQSAIRIGRTLFNKTHSDFAAMQVLNTILGGYFGSRLMSNIREEKGYTYGIGSGIVSLKQAGYFFISTEVGVEVCKPALKEIYFELKRLREEPVSQEELTLVRNHMLGSFLRSADGPFSLADKFKGIYDYGLNYSYYQNYVQTIKNITPIDLQKLANLYLKEEDLTELVVGKMQ